MATWTNKCSVEKKLCKNRAFSRKVICSPVLHRCTLDLRSFFVGSLGLRLFVIQGNLDQQVQRREKVVQKSCFFPYSNLLPIPTPLHFRPKILLCWIIGA